MGEKFENTIENITRFAATHTPEILTGVGIGGMITASIWAVKVAPKAHEELSQEGLTPWEKIKIGMKYYGLPILTGGLAAGALISSTSISVKRNTALATAYAVSEATLKKYSQKVIDTIGEKKEREIQEKIIQDDIDKKQAEDAEKPERKRIYDTKEGRTKCILMWNMVEFYSDIDKIKAAVAKLNESLAYDNVVSLNDFYSALRLYDLDSCEEGNMLGWDVRYGRIQCMYTSHLGDDGVPMLAITFVNKPRPLYPMYN